MVDIAIAMVASGQALDCAHYSHDNFHGFPDPGDEHVAEFSQGHSFTAYLGGLIAILMVYGFMWKGEIL